MKQTYTQAQIVKNISGKYVVVTQNGQQLSCIARKKISYQGQKLMVGDYVQIDQQNQSIENVLPRQNALTRPPVANIAQVLIFIAPQPEPDYFLIDKILFMASLQNITPILVVNKTDLSTQTLQHIQQQYSAVVQHIFAISATNNQIPQALLSCLKGKLTALAGQSGVGKSTFLNSLLGKQVAKTQAISQKIERGVNTTRHAEIYPTPYGQIVDTAGFSLLELKQLEPNIFIQKAYPEFAPYAQQCKFAGCNHVTTSVQQCGVQQALQQGLISKERYARYAQTLETITKEWKNRYGT